MIRIPRAAVVRTSSAILLISSVLLLGLSRAQAYNLLGGRWPNQPSANTCCLQLGVYIQPSESKDVDAFNNAISAWNDSLAYVIYSSVSEHQDNFGAGDVDDSGVGWDGETIIEPCAGQGCTYTEGQVYLNYYYTQNYTGPEAQSPSTHEFGHIAGLAHTLACVLMNPYTTGTGARWTSQCNYINTPQSDDVNGVDAQY